MARLAVESFAGMAPIRGDRLLPDSMAVLVENADLRSGELKGVSPPASVITFATGGVRSAFRIRNERTDSETWLTSTRTQFDVSRAPIVNDAYYRWYWSNSPNAPRYNVFERIAAGQNSFLLGIPRPNTALLVSVTGGSGPVETRAYLTTYVSAYGEEGQPSDPRLVSGPVDGTWQLSNFPTGPADAALRNITSIRIWRTITGVAGDTSFRPVAIVPIGTNSFTDNVGLIALSSGDPLQSYNWAEPPGNLKGMVALANGVMCGWEGNSLYFSVPYRPWAWPPEYVLSVEGDVVGVASIGPGFVAVLTTGRPHLVSGTRPESMALEKFDMVMPCLSRTSIVAMPEGVYFASQDGLAIMTQSSADLVTAELLTREQWLAYTPDRLICLRDAERILGIGPERSFIMEPRNAASGFAELVGMDRIVSGWSDYYTGVPHFMTTGGVIYRWQPQTGAPDLYRWKSKAWYLERPINLGWGLVALTDDNHAVKVPWPGTQTLHPEMEGSNLVRVKIYADERLVLDRYVNDSKPFRLPTGFKAKLWQFELISRALVYRCEFATTHKELASV